MSIKVKSLSGQQSVSYCGTHRDRSVRGLGDPIMMLEGLGITAADAESIIVSSQTPPPLVATFVKFVPTTTAEPEPVISVIPVATAPSVNPAPEPAEAPTSGGSSFPSVLAPEVDVQTVGPTPPPVADPGDSKVGVAIAVGGALVLAALFMRGGA